MEAFELGLGIMTKKKTNVRNVEEAESFGIWSLIGGKSKDVTNDFSLLKGTEVGLWRKMMN